MPFDAAAQLGDPGHPVRRVLVLGATGSIGTQTLRVLDALNGASRDGARGVRYELAGLAAGRNAAELAALASRWPACPIALADDAAARSLPEELRSRCITGPESAERLVRESPCDIVVAAVVGSAGLPATLAAVQLGRDVALANKETLVAAGGLVLAAAERSGSRLFPVDSEHSGVWQCLRAVEGPGVAPPMSAHPSVRRVTITASGGAFRDRTRAEVASATPEQALRHPTWSMGAKVTIDSATLANKALELIEAHWLFGLGNDRLDAVIHRQSTVHAIVELVDGSTIAQLGPPDMATPIRLALTAPEVAPADGNRLDLAAMGRLDFEHADERRFPALALARRVIDEGGSSGAVFNAANEAAVGAFLEGRLPFGRIDELGGEVLDAIEPRAITSLAGALDADAEARRWVEDRIARGTTHGATA